MALATYGVVVIASILVTELGLGQMNPIQWCIFIGFALIGNAMFFVLFRTNTNLRFRDPTLTGAQIVYSALWGLIPLSALPDARPIILMFHLPAFSFGMLRLSRRQYLLVTACIMTAYGSLLAVETLRPRTAFSLRYELFLFILYGLLLVWFASFGGFVSAMRRKMRAQSEAVRNAHKVIEIEVEERKHAQFEKDRLIEELQDALGRVKQLTGLLPICASCKRIRDDQGSWKQIESYIRNHSEVEFSHGFCPECAEHLYPSSRRDGGPPL